MVAANTFIWLIRFLNLAMAATVIGLCIWGVHAAAALIAEAIEHW
jgi:hypothetical protein